MQNLNYKTFSLDKQTSKQLMYEALAISNNKWVDILDCEISPARRTIEDKTPEDVIEMIGGEWSHVSCIIRVIPEPKGEFGIRVKGEFIRPDGKVADVDYFLFMYTTVDEFLQLMNKYNLEAWK